jgi:uncharacterized protein DUF4406
MQLCTQRMKIYVAGPYSSESADVRLRNVNGAIDAGLSLFRLGHVPYIPHLTHYVDQRASEIGVPMEWSDYIDWDLQWLKCCDALLFLGESKGANVELHEAQQLGKLIFRSLAEVPSIRVAPELAERTR